jgi:hypothetical protein
MNVTQEQIEVLKGHLSALESAAMDPTSQDDIRLQTKVLAAAILAMIETVEKLPVNASGDRVCIGDTQWFRFGRTMRMVSNGVVRVVAKDHCGAPSGFGGGVVWWKPSNECYSSPEAALAGRDDPPPITPPRNPYNRNKVA